MSTAEHSSTAAGELRRSLPILDELVAIAIRGLSRIGGISPTQVPHTYRSTAGPAGTPPTPEGANLRYAAIAALGIGRLPEDRQRSILGGRDAATFARQCQTASAGQAEPGALALSLWAAAEVAGEPDHRLIARLDQALDAPLDTVVASWIVSASVAVGAAADRVRDRAADVLLRHTGDAGIFPHTLPPAGGVRGHVGCFADQVYPIQALARLAAATGDRSLLAPANRTAARIVGLQGRAGQWWWHYDHRDGSVVEGFPVYSVHQHGMAPMALAELAAAGGSDHSSAIATGVRWLTDHPESTDTLLAPEFGLVWRKIGRREPGKASRAAAALTTSLRPGLHLPWLDRLLPPGRIDHECRPYELGWLLYAWAGTESGGRDD